MDGPLNETRDAWGGMGCDALPDFLKLAVRQRDGDLGGRHTKHHTMIATKGEQYFLHRDMTEVLEDLSARDIVRFVEG